MRNKMNRENKMHKCVPRNNQINPIRIWIWVGGIIYISGGLRIAGYILKYLVTIMLDVFKSSERISIYDK